MTMDTSLVPYGNIVEGSRRSISHISSKDVIPKTSTDKVFNSLEEAKTMISLSPTHELLAMLSDNYASFYVKQKIFRQSNSGFEAYNNFVLKWDGMLPILKDWSDERPAPTCVQCLSFSSKSEEFSVVAVGFTDGYLRCYSHDGRLILSQQLHKGKITSLSITFPIKLSTGTIFQAELLVVCQNVLIIVDGPSLVATIVSCKDKDIIREQDLLENVSDLIYKKWKLDKQQNTSSIACISKSAPSLFDSLVETSLIGKYDMPVKGTTPLGATKVIATGQHPMIGIFNVTKDSGPPIMSKMLSAVKNKLTSAVMNRVNIGGWLGWGSGSQDSSPAPKQVNIQPASSLSMSCNLDDQSRAVDDVIISPCGRLATAVDSFGRILLVDTQRMLITKMWKGYRGAQCGWLIVDESSVVDDDSTNRQALCLCVYIPKRGLLELWPVQRGPKVASFNIGKGCRLLYTGRVVFNNSVLLDNKASVILLTPSGQLITVSVPFHLLLRTDSTKSRDLHLLSTLPQLIVNADGDTRDDILETILTMLCLSVIDKAIKMLVSGEISNGVKVPLIVKILNSVLSRLPAENQKCMGGCSIRDYLERMKQLVQFYGQVDEMYHQKTLHALKSKLSVEDLESCGSFNQQMADNLTFCINHYFQKYPADSVKHEMLTLDQFLKCFRLKEELTQDINISLESEEKHLPALESPVQVFIKKLSNELLTLLGFTLFKGFLSIQASDKDMMSSLLTTGIPCHTLLDIAVITVLSGSLAVHQEPYITFHSIAKLLNVLIPLQGSLQFDDIFEQCCKAVLPGHALLLAMHIINHTSDVEIKDEKDETGGDGWETVSVEKERWFTVINQLHTLALLSLLNNNNTDVISIPLLPKLDSKASSASLSCVQPTEVKDAVSVVTIQQYGYHVITSVVAHWLVINHIAPNDFDISQFSTETTAQWQIYLLKLCNELQLTLSRQELLAHIIWDIVCTYNQSQDTLLLPLALNCLECLESQEVIEGCATLLWYKLFQEHVLASLQQLRKLSPSFPPNFKKHVSYARLTLYTLMQMLMRASSSSSAIEEHIQTYDIWKVYQSAEMETELSISTQQYLLSITDIIQNSPRPKTECVQLHYMALLTMDIAITFNLFPLRIFTIVGSQAKDSLGEELHFEVGPLEKEGKRSTTLERSQKQFIAKVIIAIITQADVEEPIKLVTADKSRSHSLDTWIHYCAHLSSLLGVGEQWCWCKYVYLLYAAGMYDKGDQVDFLEAIYVCMRSFPGLGDKHQLVDFAVYFYPMEFVSLTDKSSKVDELLSLCGWKINKLMSEMEGNQMANLMANLSPNILQWIKKQAKTTEVPAQFPLEQYTWQDILSLLHSLNSHSTPEVHGEIISQLITFVQYCTSIS